MSKVEERKKILTEFEGHLNNVERLTAMLKRKKVSFRANDNISKNLIANDLEDIEKAIRFHFEHVLRSMLIDTAKDDNVKKTAERYAKMVMRETLTGRYSEPPPVTAFPNTKGLDLLS